MNLRLGMTIEENKFALDSEIQLRDSLVQHTKIIRD